MRVAQHGIQNRTLQRDAVKGLFLGLLAVIDEQQPEQLARALDRRHAGPGSRPTYSTAAVKSALGADGQ